MNYAAYINSDAWSRKTISLKIKFPRCRLCNRNSLALHVHHCTYKRLGHEAERDLIVLCEECHKLFTDNYEYNGKVGVFYPKTYDNRDIQQAMSPRRKRKKKKHA